MRRRQRLRCIPTLVFLLLSLTIGGYVSPVRSTFVHAAGAIGPAFVRAWHHGPSLPQKIEPSARAKIEPLILKELASKEKTTTIVYLTQQADLGPARRIKDKLTRRQAVVSSLQTMAERSQQGIRAYLDQQRAWGHVEAYVPFWIFNGLAVTGDLETLLALAARPEVEKIRANHEHQLPNPKLQPPTSSLQSVVWNIVRVRADQVWREFGITGRGAVVANMDSGVDWLHPALVGKYRGADGDHEYNWFDFTTTYPLSPGDGSGHGTHIMGTIVGDDGAENQIGMAPGAQWIAVKIFDDDGHTTDVIIHQGFQWLLAPTGLNGRNPDPSKAPDVVNNSWGHANGADPTFWPDVAAWRAAGIFPVFSAGNRGPEEGTVGSPGSFPHTFAVGATDVADLVLNSSSRGPSFWEEVKPEVSAPGQAVRSSLPSDRYALGSGTSTAAPHVAGLAALLLEADPTLTADDLEAFMAYTALDLGEPGPDNGFGAGRIDAYEAVRWALGAGKLYGQVTASNVKRETSGVKRETSNVKREASNVTGVPISGATVSGVSQADERFVTTTEATGAYTVSVPGGFYEVTASAFGYLSTTVKGVEVVTDYTSMRDLALKPAPRGILSGWVTEAGTGEPLSATVSAVGTPASALAGADGGYSLALPVGSYMVEASLPGHQVQQVAVEIVEEMVTHQDFTLSMAPSLLLVDADVWNGDNVTNYYKWALDQGGYLYDTRLITDTAYVPTFEELGAYDVVIWANPWSSPGHIDALREVPAAVNALMIYLEGGGRLLISGQDIGFWDSEEGPEENRWAPLFYGEYLHADYEQDRAPSNKLIGVAGEMFEDLVFRLEDVYAYKKEILFSDVVGPADAFASTILTYEGDGGGGLKVERDPYRVVYFSFGLESVPRTTLVQLFERAIAWLSRPSLIKTVDKEVAARGEVLSYTIILGNASHTDLPGVILTDPIPEHTVYVPDSITGGAAYDPDDDCIQWSGTLPAATQMTFTFQAAIMENGGWRMDNLPPSIFPLPSSPFHLPTSPFHMRGTIITNTATLDDGQGRALQASAVTTVVGPNLAGSTKGVDKAGAPAGDVLTYTIALRNSGTVTATASLVDPLPAHTTYVSESVTGGAVYNPALDQIEWMGTVSGVSPEKVHYTWSDSDTPGGPTYDWVELRGVGIPILGLGDDDSRGPFPIGFTFPFFGREYATFRLCDNGFLSFTSHSGSSDNRHLPDPTAPENLLAVFWDDLLFTEDARAYYWTNNRDTLVVSYVDVPRYSIGGPYTFQVILHADGSIIYQYQSMQGPRLDEATIGLQNEDGTQGLTIACDEEYIHDELAILITPSSPAPEPTLLAFQVALDDPLPAHTIVTNMALISDGLGVGYERTATTVVNTADLTASTKAVNTATAAPGDILTYTIALRNGGYDEATNVRFTDPVPTHTTTITESVTGGASYDPVLNQIEWSGSVSGGSERAFTFAVVVDRGTPEGTTITNTATIDDGLRPSCLRSATTTVKGPDLRVSLKGVDKIEAASGDTLTYTLTLVNTGEMTATGVSLVDPLPAHTAYVPHSASEGASYNPTLNRMEWGGMVPGAGLEDPLYTWMDSDAPGGPIYAWVDITEIGTPITDLGDDDNVGPFDIGFSFPFFGEEFRQFTFCTNGFLSFSSASKDYCNQPLPSGEEPFNALAVFWDDLTFAFRGSAYYWTNHQDTLVVSYVDVPHLGYGGPYTFQVINRADGSITYQYRSMGPNLDAATIGLQNKSGTKGLTIAHLEPCVHDGLAILIIPPSGQKVVTFQAKVADSLPPETVITNMAFIEDGHGNVYERGVATLVNRVDLAGSTKSAAKSAIAPGDSVTYTVTLRNTGNADAASVTVTDPLPPHTTYVPDSVTGGASYDEAADQIRWHGTVPAGGQVSFAFAVRAEAPQADGTVITNTATIHDGLHPQFTRSATTEVTAPDLALSEKRSSQPAVSLGGTLTYTILVKNTGNGAATVTLVDPLPADTAYLSGSAWAGSGQTPAYDPGSQRLTWSGHLPPHGLVEIRFAVRVVGVGPIHNGVTLDDGLGNIVEKSVTTLVLGQRHYLPLLVGGYDASETRGK